MTLALMKHPLRRILSVGFILPFVGAVGLVEYLAWKNERAIVQQLVLQLQQRVGERIEEQISDYLEQTHLSTALMGQALSRGDLKVNALKTWAPYLLDQGELFQELTYLYYGNRDGDYIELAQRPAEKDEVIFNSGEQPDRIVYFSAEAPDQPAGEARDEPYDPRTRPWYQTAAEGTARWTEIYKFVSSDLLEQPDVNGLSFVRPHFDQDGETLLGVIGADFSVTALSQFLHSLVIGKSGTAFILDRQGKVVADASKVLVVEEARVREKDNVIPSVLESPDPLVQGTGQQLFKQFGDLREIQQDSFLSFRRNGDRQLVQVSPFSDDYGLDWLVVVVVPESDFTGSIRMRALVTLLLSLAVLALALLLALMIAHYISTAMHRLREASEAIAQGELSQQVSGSAIQELDVVAKAFNDMSQDLKKFRTQLNAHSQTLEAQVQQRTHELVREVQIRQFAELSISRSERRYRSLFKEAPIALWEEDFSEVKAYLDRLCLDEAIDNLPDYLAQHSEIVESCMQRIQVLEVNQIALDLFGASSKEDLISRLSLPHSEEVLEDFRLELTALWNGEQRFEQETVAHTSVGEQKQLLVHGFLAAGHEQDWSRVLISILDLTVRKQAEMAMQEAKEAAEIAHQTKSEFLANMSHELRSPLNAILGFAQLMTRSQMLSREHRENLSIISRSGEYLLELINDVLDMSKIEAGRIALNSTDFDLHHLLEDVRRLFQLQAEQKQLRLILQLQDDLPRYIRCDEAKLRQVLINLLSNAVKFTSVGEITIRVTRLSPFVGPEHQALPHDHLSLKFEVQDTGVGMSSGELAKAFEPFVQAQAGREIGQGTGLGLPISRKFAQLMGGDLSLTSEMRETGGARAHGGAEESSVEGHQAGTIATVIIQAQAVSLTGIDIRASEQCHILGLEPGQPQFRILVVDDHAANRTLLLKLLQPLGFDVQTVADGQMTMARAVDWQPHLILMDLRIAGMDGLELTRSIRAQNQRFVIQPKIIALSASSLEERRQAVFGAGCDAFLGKPFQEVKLLELISQQLGASYLYGISDMAGERGPADAEATTLDLAALRRLAPAMREQLSTATLCLDWPHLCDLIAEIRLEEPELAGMLHQAVHNFDYGQLLDGLNAVQDMQEEI